MKGQNLATFVGPALLLAATGCMRGPAVTRAAAEPPAPHPSGTGVAMTQASGPGTEAVGVGALDDAQRASAVAALSQRAVRMAELAENRSTNEELRHFAHQIVTSGADTETLVGALLDELGRAQQDSAVSEQVRSDERRWVRKLKLATGKDFDETYLEEQLLEASTALNLVDRLAEQARSQELAAELQRFRDLVVARIHMVLALREPKTG